MLVLLSALSLIAGALSLLAGLIEAWGAPQGPELFIELRMLRALAMIGFGISWMTVGAIGVSLRIARTDLQQIASKLDRR